MPTRTISLSLRDAKGKTSIVELNAPDTAGFITTENLASDVGAAIDDITGCVITGLTVTAVLDLPEGVKTTADADSDVEEGAMFIWRTEGGNTVKMRIAGFLESLILAGTDVVDVTDTDVDQFVDLMIDGIEDVVNGDVAPTDKREEDITALISAKESFRNSYSA